MIAGCFQPMNQSIHIYIYIFFFSSFIGEIQSIDWLPLYNHRQLQRNDSLTVQFHIFMRDDFYSTWINCCLLDRSARQVSSSDYVDQFDIYQRLAIRNPLNKSNANSRHWKYESLLRTREYSPHGVRLVWSGIRLIMLISSSYLLFCYDSCEEVDKRHSDKRT